LPLTTLGQETRWAYSTTPPQPTAPFPDIIRMLDKRENMGCFHTVELEGKIGKASHKNLLHSSPEQDKKMKPSSELGNQGASENCH